MNISLDIIQEQLEASGYRCACSLQGSVSIEFPIPVFYSCNQKFDSNSLYVARADELPLNPNFGVNVGIVSIGSPPDVYSSSRCSILSIKDADDKMSVYQTIIGIYRKYNTWYTQIEDVIKRYMSVQTVLELTFQVVNAQIFMLDADFKVIGHVEALANDNLWTSTVFDGWELPPEWITNTVPDFREKRDQYSLTTKVMGIDYTVLCQNVMASTDFCGVLAMVRPVDQPLRKSEHMVLSNLARIISSTYGSYLETEPYTPNSLVNTLQSLVSGAVVDYLALPILAEKNGMRINDRFVCFLFQLQIGFSLRLPTRYVRSQIAYAVKGSICLHLLSGFIVLLDLNTFGGTVLDALSKLKEIIRAGSFIVGVSNEFSDLTEVRYQYLAAKAAIEFGKDSILPGQNVFNFSDCIIQYTLRKGTTEIPAHILCSKGVRLLYEMDQKTGSEYCLTLQAFFRNKMNVVQSAKALYIHRNSLLYRLERIKEILGTDLSDYQSQLYTMISLELCKFEPLPKPVIETTEEMRL